MCALLKLQLISNSMFKTNYSVPYPFFCASVAYLLFCPCSHVFAALFTDDALTWTHLLRAVRQDNKQTALKSCGHMAYAQLWPSLHSAQSEANGTDSSGKIEFKIRCVITLCNKLES